MEEQINLLDRDVSELNPAIEQQRIISVGKFVLLSIATLGIYEIYWMYKTWRFFKQKKNLDINPAARAIFAIFFLDAMGQEILNLARSKGYKENFSTGGIALAFFVLNLLSLLPEPFGLVSLFSVLLLIKPFKALKYAQESSTDFIPVHQDSFSSRQIVLLVIGSVFWLLILVGMFVGEAQGGNKF